jgi:hypothetical protein
MDGIRRSNGSFRMMALWFFPERARSFASPAIAVVAGKGGQDLSPEEAQAVRSAQLGTELSPAA